MKMKAGALIILAALLGISASTVYATHSTHSFYGTVEINGFPAPAGTVVEVKGEGVMTSIPGNPLVTTEEGFYGSADPAGEKLIAQGDIAEGTELRFCVNGRYSRTSYFHSGEVTELNLGARSGIPPLPHAFFGSLTINGSPAPAGTLVEARSDGVVITGVEGNPIVTTEVGQYGSAEPAGVKLVVQGWIADGTRLTFYVNGVAAEETAEWREGKITELDLTVAGDAPPLPRHAFYGAIEINGSPAPAGTVIEAKGQGVITLIEGNPLTTVEEGQYGSPEPAGAKLIVQGDIAEGTELRFYINGRYSRRSYFHSGEVTELDLDLGVLPQPVTLSADKITICSARLGGVLYDMLGYDSVTVSFEWGTNDVHFDRETSPQEVTAAGPFNADLYGLKSSTRYYYRAKASNGTLTTYGTKRNFTTGEVPHMFYGSVTLNGEPAPAGTVITALGSGVTTGIGGNPIVTTEGGRYGSPQPWGSKLIVQGDLDNGEFIGFYIDGILADQLVAWRSGDITELNLTLTVEEEEAPPAKIPLPPELPEPLLPPDESPEIQFLLLDKEWNILSTPVALDSCCDTWGEFITLGDGLDVDPESATYSFDGSTQQWMPVLADYRLTPCDAIYVKMATTDIAPLLASPMPSLPGKRLNPGWNLVSLAAPKDMGVREALTSVYSVTSDLRGYNQVISPAAGQPAWIYIRDDEDNPIMLVGKGYWVFMINSGTMAGFTFTPLNP